MSGVRSLGGITNARCRQLLADYLPHGYRLRALFPVLDDHEFRAAVEDGILQAAVSYDPARGASESTWTARLIRSRLTDAARAAGLARAGDELADAPDPVNPERAYLQAAATRAVERLTPRQQAVVVARMEGDTMREAGASLSISHPLVIRNLHDAYAQLREELGAHL